MARKEYKNRMATIYFSTLQEHDEWQQEAEKMGVPLSKWLKEMVIRGLNQPKREPSPDTNPDILLELVKLRDEVATKDLLLEKQRTELLKIHQAVFLQPGNLRGIVQFDSQLIKLIKTGGVWTQDRLCEALHININDSDAMKIVSRQLQEMKEFGLIDEGARGWRWIK
jgi:hypothetical protein